MPMVSLFSEGMLLSPGGYRLLWHFRNTLRGGEQRSLFGLSATQPDVSAAEQVQILHRMGLLYFCTNKGRMCLLMWDELLYQHKRKQSCAFLFQSTLQALFTLPANFILREYGWLYILLSSHSQTLNAVNLHKKGTSTHLSCHIKNGYSYVLGLGWYFFSLSFQKWVDTAVTSVTRHHTNMPQVSLCIHSLPRGAPFCLDTKSLERAFIDIKNQLVRDRRDVQELFLWFQSKKSQVLD